MNIFNTDSFQRLENSKEVFSSKELTAWYAVSLRNLLFELFSIKEEHCKVEPNKSSKTFRIVLRFPSIWIDSDNHFFELRDSKIAFELDPNKMLKPQLKHIKKEYKKLIKASDKIKHDH